MASSDHERDDDGSVDVEAAWADIVAHWDETGTPPFPRAHSEDVVAPAADAPVDQVPADEVADAAPDIADQVTDDEPDVVTDEAPERDVRPDVSDDGAAACPPGQPLPSATEPVDDLWDDEWVVPLSHVGGEPVRSAGERDAELDAVLDDEGYQPPEPPPLPRGDVVSRFAWSGVLGAPLFFLLAALFWHSAPTWLVVGAVSAFVAGFVTLVVRMPDSRDDDDDGAVV